MIANGAVPILPSRDLGETLAFYERLGFERDRKIGKHRWVVSTRVEPTDKEMS